MSSALFTSDEGTIAFSGWWHGEPDDLILVIERKGEDPVSISLDPEAASFLVEEALQRTGQTSTWPASTANRPRP